MARWRDLLKESLRFYARHRRGLLAVSGLMLLPLVAVELASALFRGSPLIPHALRTGWTAVASTVMITLAGYLVVIVTEGVTVFYVAHRLAGRALGYRASWARGLSRARPIVTASLASLVPACGIFLLGLVPAALLGAVTRAPIGSPANRFVSWLPAAVAEVVILVRLAFLTQAAAIEGKGGFEAYHRSVELLAGRWRRVAAIVVPLQIVSWVLQAAVSRILTGPWVEPAGHLVAWVVLPLMAVATTLLYVGLRGESEGYDPARLASDLES